MQRLLFNIENSYPGFLSNTIEKKTGVDLNHDGYVGGERNAEKQFGVDLNNDGYIGGEGEYLGYFSTLISNIITYHWLGIQSKIEKTTRVDLNNDGVIGRPLDTYPSGYGGPY